MDKIEKLFRKISKKDRDQIRGMVFLIEINDLKMLEIKKLVGLKNFYRARIGKYRIIYKKEHGQNIIWEIRMRNEKTYGNLS